MKTSRREFLRKIGGAAAGTAGVAALGASLTSNATAQSAETEPKRPRNILLLMCDQFRFDAMGHSGVAAAVTPTLDGLAKTGTDFTRAYCQSPVCVPSRVSMLFGRYCHSTGVFGNANTPRTDQTSFTQVMRANGMKTACFGKLHIAGRNDLDWDVFKDDFKFPQQVPGQPAPLMGSWPAGKPIGQPAPFTDDFHHETHATKNTIQFIEENTDQPWFVQCSFRKPHNPFQPPPEHWDRIDRSKLDPPRYPDGDQEDFNPLHWSKLERMQLVDIPEEKLLDGLQGYHGCVAFCDSLFGEVIDTLERLGQRDDTLIIFTSDHGEMLFDHRLFGKWNFFEQSVRIPLLVSWPGSLPEGQTVGALVEQVDIFPTLMDLLGFETPESVQGRSMASLLRGETTQHRDVVHSEYKDTLAMRYDGKLKFILNGPDAPPELYDLENDPREITNLAAQPEYKDKVADLTTQLEAWRKNETVPVGPPLSRELKRSLSG